MYALNWDGVSDAGLKVASGMYYCTLHADGKILCNRMIMVK